MPRELLTDKYRPKSLEELDFNHTVNKFLLALAKSHDMPHLILEGCRGSGKRLRTELFLKAKYGDFRTRNTEISLDIPGKTEKKQVHVLTSSYHYQLNPNIHSVYDRSLIQVFISEILQYRVLTGVPYRIIVVEDADLLSTEAQESLRRTLETCIATCRFIFLVNREDKIISPIYSRCIRVKLASPTVTEIKSILSKINDEENYEVSDDVLTNISACCDRNMTKAINYLGKFTMLSKDTGATEFALKDYDNVHFCCVDIIENLISGTRLEDTVEKKLRKQLYELVNYCVDCRLLIRELLNIALQKIPKTEYDAIFQLCKIASERDESIRSSSKAIYHVESFCVHIFCIIKRVFEKKKKASTPTKPAAVAATPTKAVAATPTKAVTARVATVAATPTKAAEATPAKVAEATPAKVAAATPTKAVAATPTKAVAATPTKAVAATPTKAVAATPTKAVAATPTKAVAATPTKAVAATPAKADAATPAKADAATPAKADAAAPTKSIGSKVTGQLSCIKLKSTPIETGESVSTKADPLSPHEARTESSKKLAKPKSEMPTKLATIVKTTSPTDTNIATTLAPEQLQINKPAQQVTQPKTVIKFKKLNLLTPASSVS